MLEDFEVCELRRCSKDVAQQRLDGGRRLDAARIALAGPRLLLTAEQGKDVEPGRVVLVAHERLADEAGAGEFSGLDGSDHGINVVAGFHLDGDQLGPHLGFLHGPARMAAGANCGTRTRIRAAIRSQPVMWVDWPKRRGAVRPGLVPRSASGTSVRLRAAEREPERQGCWMGCSPARSDSKQRLAFSGSHLSDPSTGRESTSVRPRLKCARPRRHHTAGY